MFYIKFVFSHETDLETKVTGTIKLWEWYIVYGMNSGLV